MTPRNLLLVAASAALVLMPVFGVGPTFTPDETFKGSSLTGWHVLGNADWRAENGEIIGTPKSAGGGWLILDKSFQDLAFYGSFKCTGGCKTGIMVRTEKTADGMKGDFVSLTEGDQVSYRVTLDAQGQETNREKVRPVGAMIRYAEPIATAAAGGRGRGPGRGAVYHAGDWNAVQVIVDADIIRASLNSSQGGPGAGATEDSSAGFGPVALYVGGSGEVRFKDVAYKDLGVKETPPEQVSSRFRMQRVEDFDYSWGIAAADINHDGILDVVAGPYYYLGPDYTKRREIYSAGTFSPGTQYPATMVNFAYDFTGDGWPDVLTATAGKTVNLYVNPQAEPRRWNKYEVAPKIMTEITLLRDMDGDGKPDLVCGIGGVLSYISPDPENPTKAWKVHTISGPAGVGAHGMGVGDINGDGRMDALTVTGWYEQPPKGSQQETWTFHPENFGGMGGAEMAVYDVNGDGLNDVVTALNAHGFGLAWFEQKRDAEGKISFVKHMIMDDFSTKNAGGVTFTELHGSTFADVDGDGIPDYIVGKRYWSHEDSYTDPDPYGAAVLYWYRTVRNPNAPGGAEFVPELIHNRSGAGSHVLAVDLNGDGAMDILTATNRGTFIFWGTSPGGKARRTSSKR